MSISIARQSAKRLLNEAGFSLPVDLEELVGWRGLALCVEKNWPTELCAQYYAADRRIVVNGNHVRVRRRFSISHELGHFVLGHEQVDVDHVVTSIFGDDEESYDVSGDLEREANAFATELLMPKAWVCETAEGRSTRDLVTLIQSTCDVSVPAAWYRVMELKLGGFSRPRDQRR